VIARRAFRAMGTEIELLVEAEGAERELDAAEAELHRLEALLSRFRPDSELSRLNAAGALVVSADTARVIELALAARARSGGRFDPTLHDALVAAGYDRSFERLGAHEALQQTVARPGGGSVRVDGLRVSLARGVKLDLGGIAKGYAAERAAETLACAGPCLVNAGGDIAVRGGAWLIGAEHLTLELAYGGIATSGRDRRHWRRGGRELHHVIDPATGAPAETDLLRVTVVAPDAVEAEVRAKTLLLAGEAEAVALDAAAVVVTADGRTLVTGGLA